MHIRLWMIMGFSLTLSAQAQLPVAQKNPAHNALLIKGNALTAALLMPNMAVESQVSPRFSLQMVGFASPWKSFFGGHFQFYMVHLEGRFYLKPGLMGWHIGPHLGFGLFDLTKWNYRGTEKFQRGYNLMIGGTVGYQWLWKEKWTLDVFLGGGNSQGYYHGYDEVPPSTWIRYEGQGEKRRWNRSGEWLPYQAGIMIGYKIR